MACLSGNDGSGRETDGAWMPVQEAVRSRGRYDGVGLLPQQVRERVPVVRAVVPDRHEEDQARRF